MAARDGLAEMPPDDQQRMSQRANIFDGLRATVPRATRYTLHAADDDCSAAPPNAKRIYFVRHGEGEHNAWRATEKAAGRTPTAKRHNVGQFPPSLHDPCLTQKGAADALAAAAVARSLPRPELLVTSPMRRAVQTLLTAFDDAIAAGVPAIAHELCREAFHGTDPSVYDARLGRETLAAAYPQVDFASHVLPATPAAADGSTALIEDPLWWSCESPFFAPGGGGGRGIDEAAIAEHAHRFLQWLMARPESVIAVATHSNFLLALHHACLDGCPQSAQVFYTGELRVLSVSATPALSPVSIRAELGAQAAAVAGGSALDVHLSGELQ